MSTACLRCGTSCEDEVYLGEVWTPPNVIAESWAADEKEPWCVDCAEWRIENMWESTTPLIRAAPRVGRFAAKVKAFESMLRGNP